MSKKRNFWPLLFISIFTFTLGMIVWTIVSAVKTPVNEDKTFLESYHTIDADFNEMIEKNTNFKKKFDFTISINGREMGLTTEDIFYSQRVLEKKSDHKDMLKRGSNKISLQVVDKEGDLVSDPIFKFRVTKATNNKSDMDFSNENSKETISNFDVMIPIEGNWNITGTVELKDGTKGYFYIKTNAI